MPKLAGLILAVFALVPTTEARIHEVLHQQYLEYPGDPWSSTHYPGAAVAIDGDSIIAIVDHEGARQALLYRRGSDGQWAFSRILVQSTAPASQLRANLAMKNGLATIDLDGVTTIWQRIGGNWVQASTDGEIRHPGGHAISGSTILVGGGGCIADGYIFEKGTDGVWRGTGRLPSRAGVCGSPERDVELNYNYALINDPAGTVHAWARNGTDFNWRNAGDFELQGSSADRGGALALQNTVAVAPGSTVYRRTGPASWAPAGRAIPMDYAVGAGDAERVWYRDGLLLTAEENGGLTARVYAYVLGADGKFIHVAEMGASSAPLDMDISGNTIVTLNNNDSGFKTLITFEMHVPRVPPEAIANDFNARDLSGFATSSGSAFAIAGNQYDYIYRQTNANGDTRAVLTDSNWSRFQKVRMHVRPTFLNGASAGAGVALRYVDENNYLAVLIDANSARVESCIDGVTTVLGDTLLAPAASGGWRFLNFTTADEFIGGFVDETEVFWHWDRSLMPAQGRVALMTRNARADFDNLHAAPTASRNILGKRYDGYGDKGRPIVQVGGTWTEPSLGTFNSGLKQTSTTGQAFALSSGPAVGDQVVSITAQLDSWGSTNPVPWFGAVARYQDTQNFYYLAVRGSNLVQIRKVVGGVTTVLDGANYTVPAGLMRTYSLSVEGNQLHAYVDGRHLLWAIDDDLKEGRPGAATFRTAATFKYISANQN